MSLYHSTGLLLRSLGGVSPVALALALAFHLAKLGTRARAWHNIVRAAYPADRLGFRDTLAAFVAGVGVDAVVPARAGELVRLGLLRARLASSTFPGLVSTLLAESAFDAVLTVVVMAIAIGLGLGAGLPGSAAIIGLVGRHGLIAALAGSGVGLAAGWLGFRLRARVRAFLLEARRGLAVFAQPTKYVRTVASWQALGWALRVASVYCFLVAFHVPASLGAALLVVAVQLVVAAVPVTPGGAGPQQAILVLALSATAAVTVLGFGIGMQAATMMSDVVLGGGSLIFLTGSLHWRRIAGGCDRAPIRPIGASHAAGRL